MGVRQDHDPEHAENRRRIIAELGSAGGLSLGAFSLEEDKQLSNPKRKHSGRVRSSSGAVERSGASQPPPEPVSPSRGVAWVDPVKILFQKCAGWKRF